MGSIIDFLDIVKKKQQEKAEKGAELLQRSMEMDANGALGFRDKVMARAEKELAAASELKKLALNIENPQSHMVTIRLNTAPIATPESVDFTPSVTQAIR